MPCTPRQGKYQKIPQWTNFSQKWRDLDEYIILDTKNFILLKKIRKLWWFWCGKKNLSILVWIFFYLRLRCNQPHSRTLMAKRNAHGSAKNLWIWIPFSILRETSHLTYRNLLSTKHWILGHISSNFSLTKNISVT